MQFYFTKLLLVVKLTVFFLLMGLLSAHARSVAQTVTYTAKDVPITKVFAVLKQQTGFLFFYSPDDLRDAKPVSVQWSGLSLDQALDKLFAGQPFSYEIQGNTVVVSKVDKPIQHPVPIPPGPIDVYGRITDTTGAPLEGATVTVKGTKLVVSTDYKGEFKLAAAGGTTLVVSYVGYVSREVRVGDRAQYMLNVILHRTDDPLDDIQIVAYGTNTQRYSVGSVGTITAKDIEQQPVTNPLLALEGRVAGLAVTSTGGGPGAAVQLQVRGQNTLATNPVGQFGGTPLPYDQPLFIIDGVPFAPQNQNINKLPSVGGSSGYNNPYGGMSPFNSINPMDIESITVLKDADATSIYGSQGANGVVLITTKKGKAGKTALSVNINTGPNRIANTMPMMNTRQYLGVRREAIHQDGLDAQLTPANAARYPDLLVFDTTRDVDWSHQFLGGTSNNTDAHFTVSGGSTDNTFILSAGYTRSTYNFPGNFSDTRYSLHSGFHHSSLDHRLSIDFGMDYSYDDNRSATSAYAISALALPPDLPNLLDNAGNLVWYYKNINLLSYQKFQYLKEPSLLQPSNLTSSLQLNYTLLPGLSIGGTFGFSRYNVQENAQTPRSALEPGWYGVPSATFVANNFQTLNIEPQVHYHKVLGKGILTALVGGTYKKNTNYETNLMGTGYANDALLGSITGATNVTASDASSLYKYAAVFGQLSYRYDNKYLLNLTGRGDGSSNFGPGHQIGQFGSAGAGWIFSEEKFFKGNIPLFTYGKLFANYGTTGSDQTTPYSYQSNWAPVSYASPFQGFQPYMPLNLYNPNYGWGRQGELNLGLDLGMVHDRVLVNFSLYSKRTSNQLIAYSLPSQAGFPSVVENFNATVSNRGGEATITSRNILGKHFSWTTTFNISTNRNKLLAFPGLANSSYATEYVVGRSTTLVSGFKYLGVNDTTGLFQFRTAKGVPTYSPSSNLPSKGGDWQPLADLAPKFFGGLGNTFTYKRFSLMVFFQFSKGTNYNYQYGVYSQISPGGTNNLPELTYGKFWQKPGDKAPFEVLTTGQNYNAYLAADDFIYSSAAFSDDSYIRLKTLSFSYSLSPSWLKHIKMQGCNLFLNVQNLFTITDYKFGDPELPGRLYAIPTQRIVAGGLSFNF